MNRINPRLLTLALALPSLAADNPPAVPEAVKAMTSVNMWDLGRQAGKPDRTRWRTEEDRLQRAAAKRAAAKRARKSVK